MVRIRKREENGTTDINIYTSYNDNAVWNLPVGIFLGVKQDKKNILQLLSFGGCFRNSICSVCTSLWNRNSRSDLSADRACPIVICTGFVLQFRVLPSLISIFTAYLCCQCSNWMGLFALALTGQEWCYYVCRILVTVGAFSFYAGYVCQTTAMLFAKTDRELSDHWKPDRSLLHF